MKQIAVKSRFLKKILTRCTQLLLIIACYTCLPYETLAQSIQYRGATNELFATSDSRLVANVVEQGDSIKVEVLGIGYVHASTLAFTLVYDSSKYTLMDSLFLNAVPFASSVPQAMMLSASLPTDYFIDVTQHGSAAIANMAFFRGGLGTMSYDFKDCWEVQSGNVDKAFTLFLKKKKTKTAVQSSDFGFYVTYLPKREPKWGIDNFAVGYKYGSGVNIHVGGGVFMDYFNENLFAFRWTSSVTTDFATNIMPTAVTLNGYFQRGKFNPSYDSVTLVNVSTSGGQPTALPNTILGWDTISRCGFIYSTADANITFVPFSKKIKVDGIDYELTATDLLNGNFTVNGKTFFIVFDKNSAPNQTVSFSKGLTDLTKGTDYYAWSFIHYAFQTSDAFPAVGEKIFFTTPTCIDPSTPAGLAQQSFCKGATVAELQAVADDNTELKWYQNGEELPSSALLANGETYYARAVVETCISEDSLEVLVSINQGPQIAVAPAGAYTVVGSQAMVVVTDNNPTNAKSISIANPSIAAAVMLGDTIVVFGKTIGNTEITYTSVNELGCASTYIIPVQIGVQNPTGILAGKDIVKCNLSGGDTAIVQIAYIMGGISPWRVTISDDKGNFSTDTLINSLNDLPVNVSVKIPENLTSVPQYTTYVISNITDAMGNHKQTHYGTVRIGTNPTPLIVEIANKRQTVCAGANTLPISCSGVATIYSCKADEQIGIMNYSSNGIPSFTAINNSNMPKTATIVITPEYWYNGVVCIGEPDTAYITVLPKPNADFATSVQGLGQIQFTDASANAISWFWDFGDGTTSSVRHPLHRFAVSAPYTITLTIVSADGCTATVSKTLTVSATTDLAANFHVNLSEQCSTGNLFKFTDQSRITQPGGHTISGYFWDFGDGNTAAIANPTHTYANAGIYTVTLIVTESPTSTQSSISQTVKVSASPDVTLQTLPAFCEGERLKVPMPTINWNGNTPTAGMWSLDGFIIDPVNTYLTAADNGKELKYVISTSCGVITASAGTITVNEMPHLTVEPIVDVCQGDATATIRLTNIRHHLEIIYGIAFNANALAAGFANIGSATLSGDSIVITLPNHLPSGLYGGTLTATATNGCGSSTAYSFLIQVSEGVSITQQPASVTVCDQDGFILSVTATGKQLSYQWYRNGLPIQGATASVYEVFASDSTVDFGTYYVEVSGLCGTETSQTVEVKGGGLSLIVKWTDVIFISNENDYFTAYQWYKNGNPIGKDGNYQSYVEDGGLHGTYYVVVTYSDGHKEISCPRTVLKPASSTRTVSVYPNPTQPYSEITIDMSGYPLSEVENSKFEVIDMLGQHIAEATLVTPLQKVYLNISTGIYMYRITTKTNEVITGKILVH
jgi:PKD repeat protein